MAPEARVPLAADHQVIVDGNAQYLCGFGNLLGHLDIITRHHHATAWDRRKDGGA
jgi:hypothetical protein